MKRNKFADAKYRLNSLLLTACMAPLLAVCTAPMLARAGDSIELTPLGTFATGVFDDGAAEIVDYDPGTERLFVVNGADATIDVLDISDPSDPTLLFQIDVTITAADAKANSVAVRGGMVAAADDDDDDDDDDGDDDRGGLVAAAVENVDPQLPGAVILFDTDGNFLKRLVVGDLSTGTKSALPDMVAFSPNGEWLLVANEGEPSDDYLTDPEGSVSIVDLRNGVSNATVVDVDFRAFNDASLDPSIRVFGPNATVAQDLEPEYIAISDDSLTAWVTLQENNAVAVIDIATATVSALSGLGFKDHGSHENSFDASDVDGLINPTPWPTRGMYQPDTIASYEVDGQTFLITANEGDARDYVGFSEEASVAGLMLDPTEFPNAAALQQDTNLGALTVTSTIGDTDNDGDFDEIFSFGARSFSIWSTGPVHQVFDSGDDLQQITVTHLHEEFNSTNDANDSFDNRSDDKGSEPEGLTVGEVAGRTYAFIGLERIGGIVVYDVSDPYDPTFVQYINTRDFSGVAAHGTAGDLAPEGLAFIPASDSPIGQPILAVAYEVSGSTTIFAIDEVAAERRSRRTLCNTTMTGRFDDVVAVPGGTCVLSSATVNGNVTAVNRSDLFILGGEVDGNIEGNPGSSVVVLSSFVDGNIRCTDAAAPNGCQVSGAIVDGNVRSTNAEGGFVNIFSNHIDGDVEVSGSAVQAFVSLNTIEGDLECRGNIPAPDLPNPNPDGLPPTNDVDGDKEYQCDASLGF